jgi:hypothetical protein
LPRTIRSEEIRKCISAVSEFDDLVVHAGATNVPLNESRMTFVILDHDDDNRLSICTTHDG